MLDKDFQFITFDISILIENNEWGSYKYAEQEFLQALKNAMGRYFQTCQAMKKNAIVRPTC